MNLSWKLEDSLQVQSRGAQKPPSAKRRGGRNVLIIIKMELDWPERRLCNVVGMWLQCRGLWSLPTPARQWGTGLSHSSFSCNCSSQTPILGNFYFILSFISRRWSISRLLSIGVIWHQMLLAGFTQAPHCWVSQLTWLSCYRTDTISSYATFSVFMLEISFWNPLCFSWALIPSPTHAPMNSWKPQWHELLMPEPRCLVFLRFCDCAS